MKRAIVMLGLLLALSGSIAGAAQATDSTPAATERLQALDAQILARLNATRAAHGLRPLVISNELENAASTHSRALIRAGVFQHDSPDGTSFVQRLKHFYTPVGYARWTAGENLLYNTANIDADAAIQAWLDSPPHRQNMLDPVWREVGISSIHASAAGGTFGGASTWVITMDFGARTGGSKAAMAAARLKAVTAPKKTAARTSPQKAATQPNATPKLPTTTDSQLLVPGAGAPFEPPTVGSPDPAGNGPAAAALGHRADEEETGAGGEDLAPLPPAPPSSES